MKKTGNSMKGRIDYIAALFYLSIALLILGGCAAPYSLNYSPSSVSTATGAVTVAAFRYLPAETGEVVPNEIRRIGVSPMMFDQNIDVFFRDAVFKELRFVGIMTNGKSRILSGEIQDYLIDNIGVNMGWALKVRYIVKNAQNGDVLYDAIKLTERKTSKAYFLGTMNETIKLNIEQIIKDETFIKAIN